MFFFKKLISRFFFPVPLTVGLLLAGFILWCFTKRTKTGRALVLTATCLLIALGYRWVPDAMLRNIEQQVHPAPLSLSPLPAPRSQPLAPSSPLVYVGVLGQGLSVRSGLPVNLRFNEEFVTRLVEGVRVHRALPGSTLIVSVSGKNAGPDEKRRVMNEFLALFNVAIDRVLLLTNALDTAEEIRSFKQIAGTNTVYLVSCASHLPRALLIARKDGLRAIPAPSSYAVDERPKVDDTFNPECLFPSVENLDHATRAVYEYLGLMWENVRR